MRKLFENEATKTSRNIMKHLNESENFIVLNHNTSFENALKIKDEGLKADAGKAQSRGLDGNFVWATTELGKGYGGSTIQFKVPKSEADEYKVNNTQYTFPYDIPTAQIVNIIVPVANQYREDEILNNLIPKFGEEKVFNVLSKMKLQSGYDSEKLSNLVYDKQTLYSNNQL